MSASRDRLQVQVSAEAWSSIGQLPSDAFRRLRQQLDLLSATTLLELAQDTTPGDKGEVEFTVSFDELSARCRFDPAAGILTLLNLAQKVKAQSTDASPLRGCFLPANVRASLDALGVLDRLTVETHLENLLLLASDSRKFLAAQDAFDEGGGRLLSRVGDFEIQFTVDPSTRGLFVHQIRRSARPSR